MTWLKLKILETRLAFGEFGQQTKYRRLCMERNPKTNKEIIQIAEEVLSGGGIGIAECQCHDIYLKQHGNRK